MIAVIVFYCRVWFKPLFSFADCTTSHSHWECSKFEVSWIPPTPLHWNYKWHRWPDKLKNSQITLQSSCIRDNWFLQFVWFILNSFSSPYILEKEIVFLFRYWCFKISMHVASGGWVHWGGGVLAPCFILGVNSFLKFTYIEN